MAEELLTHGQKKNAGPAFVKPVPYSLYRRCRFCTACEIDMFVDNKDHSDVLESVNESRRTSVGIHW